MSRDPSKPKSLNSVIRSARGGGRPPGAGRDPDPPPSARPEPAPQRLAPTFDALLARFESSETAHDRAAAASPGMSFRMLFDHSADALFVVDLDGAIVDVNARAVARLGYSAAELIGRNLASIEEPLPDARGPSHDSVDPDRIALHEANYVHKDGRRIPMQVRSSILVMDDGHRVLVSATDARDRVALENHVRQHQRMEAVTRLAGGLAHDFNNALTAILTHAEFLLEDLPPGSPSRADAEQIRAAAGRVGESTRQLLALSRDPLRSTEVVDCNTVVHDARPMLEQVVGDRVHVDVATADAECCVTASREQLAQILLSLADNAREAMPRGGHLAIRTARKAFPDGSRETLPSVAPGEYVEVQVEDDGVGMDPAAASHVFEPFFSTRPGGGGMGLAVAYGFAARAGGGVRFDTEPGAGTRVTLYLPSSASPTAPTKAAPATAPMKLTGTETILLVEDDEAIRTLAQRVLTRLGYSVLIAKDAGQALALYHRSRERIDLLVTDVVMPHMSGGELVRRLEALGADLKVLYMTGYTEDVLIQHGIERAAAQLLRKPFTPEPLAIKVRQVLDGGGRPGPGPSSPRRVLVVDDDAPLRSSLRRLLRAHVVVEATSLREARDVLAADQAFDVVLTDLHLGDGSGLELHRWLASRGSPLAGRTVLFSGGILEGADAEYADREQIRTLDKPFSPEGLIAMLAGT